MARSEKIQEVKCSAYGCKHDPQKATHFLEWENGTVEEVCKDHHDVYRSSRKVVVHGIRTDPEIPEIPDGDGGPACIYCGVSAYDCRTGTWILSRKCCYRCCHE